MPKCTEQEDTTLNDHSQHDYHPSAFKYIQAMVKNGVIAGMKYFLMPVDFFLKAAITPSREDMSRPFLDEDDIGSYRSRRKARIMRRGARAAMRLFRDRRRI